MKQIKFYDLPQLINSGRLTFDGDKKDLRLHSEEVFNWGAKNKKQYLAACKAIDKINYKGAGWQIYAWYDVSSYEYWMKQQEEQNYIQVTVSFDTENVPESEVMSINYALDNAIADADAIQYKYSYNPCTI